jgi:hypothetical protein
MSENKTCDFCGEERARLATFQHPSGGKLHLCFRNCIHNYTKEHGIDLSDGWVRMDGWRRSQGSPRKGRAYGKLIFK